MNSTLPPALTAHQPVVCQGPSTRRLASPSAALPRTLPRSRLGSIATRAALLLGAVLLLPAGAGAAARDAVAAGKASTCAIAYGGGLIMLGCQFAGPARRRHDYRQRNAGRRRRAEQRRRGGFSRS